MPNQVTLSRKMLTLVIGIIVAIFIAISSLLLGQPDNQPDTKPAKTSINSEFLKETAGFVFVAYSRFMKLY